MDKWKNYNIERAWFAWGMNHMNLKAFDAFPWIPLYFGEGGITSAPWTAVPLVYNRSIFFSKFTFGLSKAKNRPIHI